MKKRATITFEYDNELTPNESKEVFEAQIGEEVILGLRPSSKINSWTNNVLGYQEKTVKVEVEAVKTPAEKMAEELARAYLDTDEATLTSYEIYKEALPICERWLGKNG